MNAARKGWGRAELRGALLATGILLVAAALVFSTLRRPEPATFAPTLVEPRPAGDRLVGPVAYTVDATSSDEWRFFSFRNGSVVERPGPVDWDLAFRRFHIIANGGRGFAGRGGIADLGELDFDAVLEAPTRGYAVTEAASDSTNPVIARWYDYGFFSHLLSPKPRVYAVRTADGRYAKLELLGYYCPGARPGCITFRYVYQGDGSTSFGES